ncbi:gliding motility-associated C-terminal domain-containing protein [Dyadobacter sp. CY343]|uniref:gliding motility-associated C-terminal domain-containing protein n=1 Tax=Dyadobacter sp. CY343 TaxID=2907299 RepID=UPI001F467FD6|nr:gliding motility-associated C-terminal domain-containing protein [Dyadobacter sp. CY343]MCE7060112.1 gliding motility-associated C-terminal domain-containing protein [Dyadobacter sp. CY343]
MKNTLTIFILLSICTAQTCSSQDQPKPVSQEYESCCGTQPVEFSYQKKRIYVPNVFTPNNDGVNDYFVPFVNDIVTDVWGFTIYSALGDTILYQKPYFNSKMAIAEYG